MINKDKLINNIVSNKISAYKLHLETGLSQRGIGKIIKKETKSPSQVTLQALDKAVSRILNNNSNKSLDCTKLQERIAELEKDKEFLQKTIENQQQIINSLTSK